MSHTLLIEIQTEELPPLALNKLATSFAQSIEDQLVTNGFCQKERTIWYASPRRIAVSVDKVLLTQPDRVEEKRGPSLKAAYDADGNPTKALQGFMQSLGVDVSDLETVDTEKGQWLVLKRKVKGGSLDEVLSEYVDTAVKALPVPKRMRWGAGEYEFVRPVHGIIALHGDRIIQGSSLGFSFSNTTRGHRVLCEQDELIIDNASNYEGILEQQGKVYANAVQRRQLVMDQVAALAKGVGATPYVPDEGWDEELVDLVTALVEYPQAIIGSIDEHYMELPRELLVTSMKDHQKYFPCFNNDAELLPHFISVANIKLDNPERVVKGNQRVLRARLDDAEFFWKTDATKTLIQRKEELNRLLYHVKVGSVGERIDRMVKALPWLSSNSDASANEIAQAERAIQLMKSDLVSEVVGEFPELQGTIGRYYAERDGEEGAVALAIEEHYLPRFADDKLPTSKPGFLAAIAERIDSLITLYGAGEAPTGTRDRYALRRQAIGLIRLILATRWPITLSDMMNHWPNPNPLNDETRQALSQFIIERLRHELVQVQGFSDDVFNAVIAIEHDSIVDIAKRVAALSQFLKEDEATTKKLAAGLKRAGNFLSKADVIIDQDGHNEALLTSKEEVQLINAVRDSGERVDSAMADFNYTKALGEAASLQQPIDDFFEHVLVLDEDSAIRNARLALLDKTVTTLTRVADISLLQAQ